jgi:hypothetical protein
MCESNSRTRGEAANILRLRARQPAILTASLIEFTGCDVPRPAPELAEHCSCRVAVPHKIAHCEPCRGRERILALPRAD